MADSKTIGIYWLHKDLHLTLLISRYSRKNMSFLKPARLGSQKQPDPNPRSPLNSYTTLDKLFSHSKSHFSHL